jgi:hypothetical protein
VEVRFGRRPLFFLAIAIISLLLLAPTPADSRWVNVVMAALAFFWFVLLSIEEGQGYRVPPDDIVGATTTNADEREERS